jgi:hypothetical protein
VSRRSAAETEIDAAVFPAHTRRMAKKAVANVGQASSLSPKLKKNETGATPVLRPSSLLDSHYTKVMLDQIFGDN